LHGDVWNYGDICKIKWSEVPDFDLFTYSFPCTSISSIGLREGMTEGSGTPSSLMWECERAIELKWPRYLLMENVRALVNKKNMPQFKRWMGRLASLGYRSEWKLVNSSDYGVPQNRPRVIMVSILQNGKRESFSFPEGFKLTRTINDIIERGVDAKYYLKQVKVDGGVKFPLSRRLTEMCECGKVDTKKNLWIDAYNRTTNDKVSGTILTRVSASNHYFISEKTDRNGGYRIRKLTPFETGRLMGLTDDEVQRMKDAGLSDAALYRLHGNSIVVDVLYYIFKALLFPDGLAESEAKQLNFEF
jgi:DNA (cytosine-5)-methyltransferase 1